MDKTLVNSQSAPKKRKKIASLDKKKARAGWIFVLPFVIGFLVIYAPMVIQSIRYSFCTVRPGQGAVQTTFVGLQNYQDALFNDVSYVTTLTSGIQQLVLDIPAIVIFSLFMAVLLNQKMLGRAVFRAIFFIPVILATGLVDEINSSGNTLMSYMSSNESIETGTTQDSASDIISRADIAMLFSSMKVGTELVSYVTQLVNNIYDIINRCGVQMLVFLAGLQSISPAIYESCSIDGATAWETFWKITFPMISPMILVNSIYTVIDSFTSASNKVMSLVMDTYKGGHLALSSAMAWFYFIIVIAIIAIVAGILSAYIFYQRRD